MLTRESARAAGACYNDARIAELVPAGGLTPAQVIALDIPLLDRYWALRCACGATDRTLREHACWCARQTLELQRREGRKPDPRSWAAVDVAERYARGEATEEERSAAESAAESAAWSAAWSAACQDLIRRLELQPC